MHPISSEQWITLEGLCQSQNLKKQGHVVREGELFGQEVFVESGVLRAYKVDEEGNDRSIAFFEAGHFMSTSFLRTKNGKSLYHYQALCETRILTFNAKKLKDFFSSTVGLSAIGKSIKDQQIAQWTERDTCLVQAKAKDKYLKFIEFHPRVESLISQKYIASYLGITPVSLSRIKSALHQAN